MVPGRRYRRSTSVAVRRTCGAESKLEEGKISRGQRVQTQNTKKKPLSTHKFESRRAQVRQPKSKLHRRNDRCTHQRMQWSDMTLDRSCSCMCMQYCHVIYWAVWRLFCWVEGRCCLAPAWSGVKWLDNEADKRQEHVRRRKKKVTASVRTARTVSKDANFDAPCGGFDSFSSLGLFFLGNNVLSTTVWSLSIDVSFNLQDGRTLLTCPFLASWTAFVCACNGGRTRRASKRQPRAAEVMARSRHVLRVFEVRCLPLRHFQVLAFERSTMTKM